MTPIPLPARLAVTWLAIFPLVAIAQAILQPLLAGWPPLLVTAAVMTVVVPIAVTWAVPALSRAYVSLASRRSRDRKGA
ncbi:hypothetical protein FB468_2316 [Leucobacter komagatae]|uniref:Uncharacterized protein n=1 Tax=Leucobacter komagatae TaxID=55969 RepID=A0A542Y874_9MICO|nr:hypothetical protein [Leucobacter komagatae]TQL44265.1 hypothetical protein FB468_2316 [Leucobacter komagatae]